MIFKCIFCPLRVRVVLWKYRVSNVVKMPPHLSVEQRIEIYNLSRVNTLAEAANIFNARYPDRIRPLNKSAISKIKLKFNLTGSVTNKERTRTKTATNEEYTWLVLGALALDPQLSIRKISRQLSISTGSVQKILKENGMFPYKPVHVQKLQEGDPARRMQFCEAILNSIRGDANFSKTILWTDESIFTMDGVTNRQTHR